ncbi:MAG: DUF3857 and transglutaminase domain-containing protein [Sphingomonas bacterium]
MTALLLMAAGVPAGEAVAPPARIEQSSKSYLFEADGRFTLTSWFDLRVLSPEGAAASRIVPISFVHATERFSLIEAYTEHPDGRRISFDVVIAPHAAGAASYRDAAILTFPAVTVGSRLHARFRIERLKPSFPGVIALAEAPSFAVPVDRSELEVSLPAAIKVGVDASGFVEAPARKADGRVVRRWILSPHDMHVPQPDEVAPADYGPHLDLSNLPRWSDVANDYWSAAKDKESVSPAIQALADSLTTGISGQRAIVAALADWTRHDIRYRSVSLDEDGFVPVAADESLRARQADCKARVALLDALLKAKGIESSPVLLNTAPSYVPFPVPSPAAFNHVITYVPSIDQFVDTSDPLVEDIPFQDRGKMALIVRTGQIVTTPLPAEENGVNTQFSMTIAPDGTAAGTSVMSATGEMSFTLKLLRGAARRGGDGLATAMLAKEGGAGHGKFDIPASTDTELKAGYTLERVLAPADRGAFALPYGVTIEGIPAVLKRWQRDTSVPRICQPVRYTEHFDIGLPPGMRITLSPPKNIVDPNFSYHSRFVLARGVLRVSRTLERLTRGPSCPPAVEADIAALSRRASADLATKLVFTLAPSEKGRGAGGADVSSVSSLLLDHHHRGET